MVALNSLEPARFEVDIGYVPHLLHTTVYVSDRGLVKADLF